MKDKKGKRKKSIHDDENYIPKAFQKNKNKKENTKVEKHNKKKLKKIILIIILLLILMLGIILGISAHRWKTLAKEMLANENSTVIDIDGNEITKLGSERKNIPISLANIPDNLKNAYVAIEDERFYSHGGIDIKRTGRCYYFLYF